MELQIQDLVASIRHDGIEEAQKKANAIVSEANEKAAAIISAAKEEAERIKSDAKRETDLMKQSAATSAMQAKRDAVLSFESEIRRQYELILSAKVKKVLDGEALASLIKAAISGENPKDYQVQVSQVSEELKSQLSQEIKKGLEIKPVKGVNSGFRLAAKDGSGYFDCTQEALTSMLAPFLGENQ